VCVCAYCVERPVEVSTVERERGRVRSRIEEGGDIEWPKCTGGLIFIGHFLQESPMISGSFAERDLQLERGRKRMESRFEEGDTEW